MKKIAPIAMFSLSAASVFSAASNTSEYSEAKFLAQSKFLTLPMKGSEPYGKVILADSDGKSLAEFDALMTSGRGDWRAELDISAYKGKELVLKYETRLAAPMLEQVDSREVRNYAADRGRPDYHLTAPDGWMGNPCALVRTGGLWHAIFEYNPFVMSEMPVKYFATASSKDLITWTHGETVLSPDFQKKDFPSAGDAFLDSENLSGLFKSDKGGVLVVYSSSARGTCLMYSRDMKTFAQADFNPIIANEQGVSAKSPSLFYNSGTKLWNLVRAEERGGKCGVAIYASKDLRKWKKTSEIDVAFDCPSLVKAEIIGPDEPAKWLLFDGDGKYIVGTFDGGKFSKISTEVLRVLYGDARGARFWKGTQPRLLASARIDQPGDLMRDVGQSFSQSMSIPFEIKLVRTRSAYQLRVFVADEITEMYGTPRDVLGMPSLTFTSNEFTLPEAAGNKCLIAFRINTTLSKAVSVAAGVGRMSYFKGSDNFSITRVNTVKIAEKAQAALDNDFVDVLMFLDTYSTEWFIGGGMAALFLGDSFINPYQTVKLGGVGEVYTDYVTRYPIMKESVQERGRKAREKIGELLGEKR